jgi:hypothetical protein
MRNYKNKVCFVQSEEIFQDDTREELLKIKRSQLLTSNDEEEIFDFIKDHVSKNNVFHFLLHIDSNTLSELLDYMEERKQYSRKTRIWLNKCIFVATYSNASYVRTKVKSLNARIYFALNPISGVLSSIPDGSSSVITNPDGSTTNKPKEIMLVVSNTSSPFFNEVYDFFNDVNTTLQKMKLADFTLEKLNTFATGGGHHLILSLDSEQEYNQVGSIIKNSTFRKTVQLIECTQILSQGFEDIRVSVGDVLSSSSGVSIQAEIDTLNRTLPYEACAASLTLTWKCWHLYIEGRVVNTPK